MKKTLLILSTALLSFCAHGQYLPLTAGSSYPLTGDLFIDGTNGNRIIFSYGGTSNNKALLGNTYSILGTGSKDDLITYIRDNNPYSIWTNSNQRFVVSGNGNVGIGTVSPSYNLHINKSTASLALDGVTGSLGNSGAVVDLLGWATSNKNWQIGVANLGPDGFTITPSTTAGGSTFTTPALLVNSDGNVAIGTTDPQGYKLAVNGDAIATSMTVKLYANWPDYVFKPKYNLLPLTTLKTYINQTKHLPEIPSEEEVVKNGVNLGEMNKLLLKKVEELTLYLIEKDKQLSKQEIRLKKIERRLKSLPTTNKLNHNH